MYYIIEQKNHNANKGFVWSASICVSIFAIVKVVITKFSETYANKSSAFIRLYDFKLGMELFLRTFGLEQDIIIQNLLLKEIIIILQDI